MADKGQQKFVPGGMMNLPRVQYSKETHNLLKDLMQESKLTNFQQRQIKDSMKDGQTLPTQVHPTSSAKSRRVFGLKPKSSKVSKPRLHTPQLRTRETIEQGGDLQRPSYAPVPGKSFSEKDKTRLQNMMAYGQDVPPPDPRRIVEKIEPDEKPEPDRFEELEAEVKERQEFLEEMTAIGKGEQYRTIINTEISRIIREMEVIDRKRTKELESLLAKSNINSNSNEIPKP